jgi:hypothetical protein
MTRIMGNELDGYFAAPHVAPPRWLAMIWAYLDETGQETKDYVIIAGHFGYEQSWGAFVPAWKQALGPQRKRLHMNELRFNKPSEQRLLARLGPIPTNCGLKRLIGGARVSDYEDLVPSNDPIQKLFSGYVSALMSAVTSILMVEIPDDERIEIRFEQQDRYAGWANFAMERICNIRKPMAFTKQGIHKISGWGFMPKNSTMLLDQADYLCYAELQRKRNPHSKKAQWTSPILDAGTAKDTIGEIKDREFMRDAVKEVVSYYSIFPARIPSEDEVNDQ